MNNNSKTKIQEKLCLATVSTKDYWPGTKVMIKSFLHHNKWFQGDIIVISDDAYIEKKVSHQARIQYLKPSIQCIAAVDALCTTLSKYQTLRDRFYLFEIFKLINYDRVIFADSDMLFISDFEESDLKKFSLAAVLDPWHYRGYKRAKESFEIVSNSKHQLSACYENFYNTGFLVITKMFLKIEYYNQLLSSVTKKFLEQDPNLLADESIINWAFEGNISSLDISYNCPVHLIIENVVYDKPISIHFTGKHKPWHLSSWFHLNLRTTKYFKYLVKWLWAVLTY